MRRKGLRPQQVLSWNEKNMRGDKPGQGAPTSGEVAGWDAFNFSLEAKGPFVDSGHARQEPAAVHKPF